MLEMLYPDIYIKSIFELPVEHLKEKGIKVIAFDIDNTLTPFNIAEPDDRTTDYLNSLKAMGFKICLLSNNNKNRINIYNKRLNVYAVYKAGKPGAKKFLSLLGRLGVSPKEAALVGDQVFTDVLCAHIGGVLSILTKPICNHDQFVTKIKRGAEKCVLKMYFKREGIKYEDR